ncbi:MAG: hypothetical protein K2P98_03100, partial [Neisseriaceae bacterium]|nr:hypothetical protein [Neisseriaceae bacterium]
GGEIFLLKISWLWYRQPLTAEPQRIHQLEIEVRQSVFGGAMKRTIVKPKKTSPKRSSAFTTVNDYIVGWVICRHRL